MLNTIYLLTNRVSGKVYVGQTWRTLEERWNYGHGYRECNMLANAINKYGRDAFQYTILTFCSTQETADHWEEYFINKYDSRNRLSGYNIKGGGANGPHSQETKDKISHSKLGKSIKLPKRTAEHQSKLTATQIGRARTQETKDKISQSLTGRKQSDESNAKRSATSQGNQAGRGCKGKTWKLINNIRAWIEKEVG